MNNVQTFDPATTRKIFALRRLYFRPEFIGLNSLDIANKPALFVGNHTLYGLLDVPLMLQEIHQNQGILVRSLGDREHFKVPLWRDFLVKGGMVMGTPENCDALMSQGESVLVFPGGAREVCRRKNEEYSLIWKRRLGFVRQAVKHGYDIIPFGSLGPDECYTILSDAEDLKKRSRLWKQLERSGLIKLLHDGDYIPPFSRGIGPTLIPRPQRFYFGFGERIPTQHLQGHEQDEAVLWEIRNLVSGAIEQQITQLKAIRNQDRQENWSWLRRQLA